MWRSALWEGKTAWVLSSRHIHIFLSLCFCFWFYFSPLLLPSFASAFASCTVKFCNKQRCAGGLSESVAHPSGDNRLGLLAKHFPPQSYSETTRISLRITIMTVKYREGCVCVSVSKMHCLPAASSAFLLSSACQEPTWTWSLNYNNIKLFSSWQDECYNYIKVLVPRNDETLFACGTNAFNPTCRNYKVRYCTAVSWPQLQRDHITAVMRGVWFCPLCAVSVVPHFLSC